MKKIFFAALAPMLFPSADAVAQVPHFADAIEYNDYIVNQQDLIGIKIKVFVDETSSEYSTKEMEIKAAEDGEQQAAASAALVRKMPAFNGDTVLRDAAADLFEFYERILGNEYIDLVNLMWDEALSTEEYNAQYQKLLNSITERELIYDNAFSKAQENFAKKNDFELVDPEEDDDE